MIRPGYLPDSIVAQLVSVAAFLHSLDPKEKSAVSEEAEHWSLTTLREPLIRIGARMVRYGRYVTFQMAEVAVSRRTPGQILPRIARLRAPPVPA